MKYLFIAICTIISIINWISPLGWGYTNTSNVWSHFSYIFVHANVIHLFINMFVFWKIYTLTGKWTFMFSLCVAFVASFYAIMPLPTVGASGVIFSMIGIVYATFNLPAKLYFKNGLIIAIACVIGYFVNMNIALHLYCLGGGLVVGGFSRVLR